MALNECDKLCSRKYGHLSKCRLLAAFCLNEASETEVVFFNHYKRQLTSLDEACGICWKT